MQAGAYLLDCISLEQMLVDTLVSVVERLDCDCIGLSGGIDTSTIALAARLAGLRPKAITAYYETGIPRDLPYAIMVARTLGLHHIVVSFNDSYVRSGVRLLTKCLGVDDYIEIRNDIVFLRVLEEAKKIRCKCIMLGDGGDELLAGYEFMATMTGWELEEARYRYGVRGRYPGLEIAECVGVEAVAPFLVDEVLEILLKTPSICVREGLIGKKPLRDILRHYGLWTIAERDKTPTEAGAGTNILSRKMLEEITGVRLSSPE